MSIPRTSKYFIISSVLKYLSCSWPSQDEHEEYMAHLSIQIEYIGYIKHMLILVNTKQK